MTTTTTFGSCRTPGCRTRPTPGYADRGLCSYHETGGREALTALPAQWVALQPLIYDKPVRGLSDTAGRAPFGPTEPVHLPTDALARLIVYTLTLWEVPVRERARLADLPDPGTPAAAVARAALTLTVHYAVLVATPPLPVYPTPDAPEAVEQDGPDAVVTLTVLSRRAAARIGQDAYTVALPYACHLCGWPQLRHRVGADVVACPGCRTTWPWDTYQAVREAHLFGALS